MRHSLEGQQQFAEAILNPPPLARDLKERPRAIFD